MRTSVFFFFYITTVTHLFEKEKLISEAQESVGYCNRCKNNIKFSNETSYDYTLITNLMQ